MKTSRFSELQIAVQLKQVDDGFGVQEVCRKGCMAQQTYYRWRKKYGGLMPSELNRLKQMVADLSLDKAMPQDVPQRKLEGLRRRVAWLTICKVYFR